MTFLVRKTAPFHAVRPPRRAAAARVMLAAAAIAGLGGAAFALPAVQSGFVVKVAGHYQEQVGRQCAVGAATCYLDFSNVPANRQLIVTHISCHLSTTTQTGGFGSISLGKKLPPGTGNTNDPPHSYLRPTYIGASPPYKYYVVDSQILHLFDAGLGPRVFAYPLGQAGTRVTDMKCTISGTLRAKPGS